MDCPKMSWALVQPKAHTVAGSCSTGWTQQATNRLALEKRLDADGTTNPPGPSKFPNVALSRKPVECNPTKASSVDLQRLGAGTHKPCDLP